MKKPKIVLTIIFIALPMLLLVESKELQAFDSSNYELSLCTINYPDGTTHLAAQCIYPNSNGPCDRVSACSGGAPPPEVK